MQMKDKVSLKTDNKGFTLIELIMAVAIMTLVMSALVIMVSISLKQYGIVGADVNIQQNAQVLMEHIEKSVMESSSQPRKIKSGNLHGYAMDTLSNDGKRAVRIIVLDKNSHKIFTKLMGENEFVNVLPAELSNSMSAGNAGRGIPLADVPDNMNGGNTGYTDLNDDFDISDDINIVDETPAVNNEDNGKNENGSEVSDGNNSTDNTHDKDKPIGRKDSQKKSLSSRITAAMLESIVNHPEQNLIAECVENLTFEEVERGNLIPVKISMNMGGRTLKMDGKYRMRNASY